MAKSSTAERKEDIAKAFESAVGDGGQAKKATDAFLADRAGNLPAEVQLDTGAVRVQNKDERVVLRLGLKVSKGENHKNAKAFVEKILGRGMALAPHHVDRGWGMVKVAQSQVTKLLEEQKERTFVSDSGKVEVQVRAMNEKGEDYYLAEGHWSNLDGASKEEEERPKKRAKNQSNVDRPRQTPLSQLPYHPVNLRPWYGQPSNGYSGLGSNQRSRTFPFKGKGRGGKGGY